MVSLQQSEYWELIHAERERLSLLLDGLGESDWRRESLCSGWTVEEVTAHLTATAVTGTVTWLRSMITAGFNPARHNERMLRRHLGPTPQDTLAQFRATIPGTIAPTRDYGAWLGEVIVHGQDISQVLGAELIPDPAALHEVAGYFVRKNFTVNSRSLVRGLQLVSTDTQFRHGRGPLVQGQLLDLVMVMAGRPAYCELLEGAGVPELRRRLG